MRGADRLVNGSGWTWILIGVGVIAGMLLSTALVGIPRAQHPPIFGPYSLEFLDLAAQRSMSDAAWWMVALTGVGVLVGTLSLYLLKLNLDEARKVTREAAASTRAAEAAVAEAKNSSAETFALGKKQVKAYVSASNAHITINGTNVQIGVTLVNSGQSPGYLVRVQPTMRIWTDNVMGDLLTAEDIRATTLQAAGSREEIVTFTAPPISFLSELRVFAEFKTEYYDAFDDQQVLLETYVVVYKAGAGIQSKRFMNGAEGSML